MVTFWRKKLVHNSTKTAKNRPSREEWEKFPEGSNEWYAYLMYYDPKRYLEEQDKRATYSRYRS